MIPGGLGLLSACSTWFVIGRAIKTMWNVKGLCATTMSGLRLRCHLTLLDSDPDHVCRHVCKSCGDGQYKARVKVQAEQLTGWIKAVSKDRCMAAEGPQVRID